MAGRPLNRQNEYFVPRDGIDREVITADICRYLGNDALVRPGTYENKETGQLIQGYYINAYRNLTTAMIEDLKEASRLWAIERTRVNSGAYRHSETHQRQQGGGGGGSMVVEPQYTTAPVPASYDPRYQQPQQAIYSQSAQTYATIPQTGGYQPSQGNYAGYQQPNTYSPPPRGEPGYQAPAQAQYGQSYHPGADRPVMYHHEPQQDRNRFVPPSQPPAASVSPVQPGYTATTAPPQQYYQAPPQGVYVPQNQVQPQDALFGRRPFQDPRSEPQYAPEPVYDDQSKRTVTPTSGAGQPGPTTQRNQRDSKGHHHRPKYS